MSSQTRTGQIRTWRKGNRSTVRSELRFLLRKGRLTQQQYDTAISTLDALLAKLPENWTTFDLLKLAGATFVPVPLPPPPAPEPPPKPSVIEINPPPASPLPPPTPAAPRRSPKQLAALAAARQKRAIAAERTPPEGYRSVEHFLDDAREFVGRRAGATMELARYLNVDESNVRGWLTRKKIPLQPTLDDMHLWLINKKSRPTSH
jgi:hypothetical protein